MKTIPYNANWSDSGGSLDLLAVYRRPRTQAITKARLIDDQGRQLWDYVNLPLKRHNDHLKKGFQYVTLARVSDLISVGAVSPNGQGPTELLAAYRRHGEFEERTFLIQDYLTHAESAEDAQFGDLQALVRRLGSEVVEQVSRASDPTFTLPESLRGIAPGGAVPAAAPKAPKAHKAKKAAVQA